MFRVWELARKALGFPTDSDFDVDVDEGINDKNIFKAIFMAGGAGSGKSFIMKRVIAGHGFKVYESDALFELALRNANLKSDPETIHSDRGKALRTRAFELSDKRAEYWMAGRLPVVYDGTGQSEEKIKRQAGALRDLGYDVAMVFVSTTLDTSIARDQARSRTLGPEVVTKIYKSIQGNLETYKRYFGKENFIWVDNDEYGRNDLIEAAEKKVAAFIRRPVSNPNARIWRAMHK